MFPVEGYVMDLFFPTLCRDWRSIHHWTHRFQRFHGFNHCQILPKNHGAKASESSGAHVLKWSRSMRMSTDGSHKMFEICGHQPSSANITSWHVMTSSHPLVNHESWLIQYRSISCFFLDDHWAKDHEMDPAEDQLPPHHGTSWRSWWLAGQYGDVFPVYIYI